MDLISRQAAIDAIAEVQGIAASKGELTTISKMWKKIKKLPSAQPERKKGKWTYIKNVRVNHSIKICRCSVCGLPSYGSMDFCSRCGADMRGEDDV